MNAVFKNRSCCGLTAILLALAVQALLPASARAQIIDPATLHVSGTVSGTQDPTQLGNTGQVTITQVSNKQGATPLLNPVALIVGIVNDPTNSSHDFFGNSTTNQITSISFSSDPSNTGKPTWQLGGANPFPGTGSGSWDSSTGFAGEFTSGKAYDAGGFTQADSSSNNFANWSGSDSSINGITANFFNLYVFQLSDSNGLPVQGSITVQFADLPQGSYVMAYSWNGTSSTNPNPYDTAWTNTGLETGSNQAVPAPSSALLAGFGALSVCGFAAVRRRQSAAAMA